MSRDSARNAATEMLVAEEFPTERAALGVGDGGTTNDCSCSSPSVNDSSPVEMRGRFAEREGDGLYISGIKRHSKLIARGETHLEACDIESPEAPFVIMSPLDFRFGETRGSILTTARNPS